MIPRALLLFLVLGAIAGSLGFYKYSQIQSTNEKNASFAPPPVAVTSVKSELLPWSEAYEATASFAPVQGVVISTEESGTIVQLGFESGQRLEQGALIVQLDVSVEQAELKSAMARADLAIVNLNRIRKLEGTGALADREADDSASQVEQTSAEVERLQAVINRKTLRAPFPGIAGIRQVQLGQYLSPGDPVVSLETLDPIYANFSVPQQLLSHLKVGQTIAATVDAFPGREFPGAVSALDSRADPATRTIQVQATLPNPDSLLRPGMFGRVLVTTGEPRSYVTLPSTAINRAPYGDSVYLIEPGKTPDGQDTLQVRPQLVKLGPSRGDQVAILQGLDAGTRVVSSGLFKLRPNATVTINNDVIPSNLPNPTPDDS